MNNLYPYQTYTGGVTQPMYDPRYQTPGVLDALFKDLTQQQLLSAFTPRQVGQFGGSSYLDGLLGMQQPAAMPGQPAAPEAEKPKVEEVLQALFEGRNDGYDAPGGFAGADGYGLYGNSSATAAQPSGGYVGAGLSSPAVPSGGLQEATSTHGGANYQTARDAYNYGDHGGGPSGGKGG